MSGANRILNFQLKPLQFNLLLKPAQWKEFIALLKKSSRTPPGYDAYAGYSFTQNKPIYFEAVHQSKVVLIAGRQTRTSPTNLKEITGIKRTHWTGKVALEYHETSFFLERGFFFKLRAFCLQLDALIH